MDCTWKNKREIQQFNPERMTYVKFYRQILKAATERDSDENQQNKELIRLFHQYTDENVGEMIDAKIAKYIPRTNRDKDRDERGMFNWAKAADVVNEFCYMMDGGTRPRLQDIRTAISELEKTQQGDLTFGAFNALIWQKLGLIRQMQKNYPPHMIKNQKIKILGEEDVELIIRKFRASLHSVNQREGNQPKTS